LNYQAFTSTQSTSYTKKKSQHHNHHQQLSSQRNHIVSQSTIRIIDDDQPHHDNQHIIHQRIIDSILFHHIIMNTKPIASHHILFYHFTEVCLSSPKFTSFYKIFYFQIFHQDKTSCSYTSLVHSYLLPNIMLGQAYHHHFAKSAYFSKIAKFVSFFIIFQSQFISNI